MRELRCRVETPGFRAREVTPATTLLDGEAYPASELSGLYAGRWAIELNLRRLKTTMRMDALRRKTESGATKELTAYCLVYNLARSVMLEAARRQEVAVERISFVDGLRWLASARRRGIPDARGQPAQARSDRAEGGQEAAQALRAAGAAA